MKTYRVQSAEMDVEVEATTPKMAAIKAIDENNPDALGAILVIQEITEEVYLSSQQVLEDMGMDVEES